MWEGPRHVLDAARMRPAPARVLHAARSLLRVFRTRRAPAACGAAGDSWGPSTRASAGPPAKGRHLAHRGPPPRPWAAPPATLSTQIARHCRHTCTAHAAHTRPKHRPGPCIKPSVPLPPSPPASRSATSRPVVLEPHQAQEPSGHAVQASSARRAAQASRPAVQTSSARAARNKGRVDAAPCEKPRGRSVHGRVVQAPRGRWRVLQARACRASTRACGATSRGHVRGIVGRSPLSTCPTEPSHHRLRSVMAGRHHRLRSVQP